ncbi:MAG: ATP-binding protein, partial [Thermoanaerobaculia bacterium]
MTKVKELDALDLYRHCDFGDLRFDTTDDLEQLHGLLGQPRAEAAIEFGIGIEFEGYNIFALGPPGTGKHTAVMQYLEGKAAAAEVPPDICYVNDFGEPHKPKVLELPAGRGSELQKAMRELLEEVRPVLETALESEEYQTRKQVLEQQFEERQGKELSVLGDRASEKGLALVRTPVGIVFAPMGEEEVLSPEEFQKLPDKEQKRLEKEIEGFKEDLQKVLRQLPRWQREASDKLRKLHLDASRFAVKPLFDELREQFEGLTEVEAFLDAAEDDFAENASRMGARGEKATSIAMDAISGDDGSEKPSLRRYRVNLLVDHRKSTGAPVIYEDNPTYQNLVGRVEHIPQMGAVVTDFNVIKAGALHRANGGYLLVDALKVLQQPFAYEGLKRALQSRKLKIESLGEAMSLMSTYSLEPEPIDSSVKVVLLGSPMVYYLLPTLDPEFGELFKVAADFARVVEWSDENQELYARLIAKLVQEEALKPFDRTAVARVIEHSARSVGDSQRMSLLMSRMLDLMREADYWAGNGERGSVGAEDVQRAIDNWIFRSDRLRERTQEEIDRGTMLLDTEGEQVGQVNGLSVVQMGDFAFGRPSRITARVRLGKGDVVDIEREVELSGPFHSKGVLILSGFLGARYAKHSPLSLSASLVFEQSYSGIDGDSASSAELYALLSAIAEAPIRQSLAVTGSVNQLGQIQAIGGVNDKIEGFFDVCTRRGLTGDQGVLIPASNTQHLMLRQDVVEAVAAGKFHVYPVETVDQGIELLTGLKAGELGEDDSYPEGSLNRRVAD